MCTWSECVWMWTSYLRCGRAGSARWVNWSVWKRCFMSSLAPADFRYLQLIRRELLQDVTVYYKVASSTFERLKRLKQAKSLDRVHRTVAERWSPVKREIYLCCLYWSAAVPGMVLVGRPFFYWKSSRCSWNDPEVCKFKDQDNMQNVYTMWYEFLTWWDTVSYPLATPEGAHWVISWKICALSDKKEKRSQDALFINVAYGRTGEAGIHSGSSS